MANCKKKQNLVKLQAYMKAEREKVRRAKELTQNKQKR